MRSFPVRRATAAALALSAIGAAATTFRVVARAGDPKPQPGELSAGAWPGDRFLGHLATDKPLYRPGEIVYGRCALLEAFTRAPMAAPIPVRFEVRSARGEVVAQLDATAQGGIAAFSWPVPEGLAGGEYELVARFPESNAAPAALKLDVRAYRVPRIDADVEFERTAYGPGDPVAVRLRAKRAEGGIPAGARVTAVATVDSVEVHRSTLALDAGGACLVSFRLPEKIAAGEGTLALVIEDGGVQETAARTIPIVVNKVLLEAFPEGGDLVSGLETRLYFEARTPRGKPATVKGRLVDRSGATVASFASAHEGRGRIAFTPRAEAAPYALVVDEPAGIADRVALPAIQAQGYALGSDADSAPASEPVRLRVGATKVGRVRVVLASREKEVAALTVDLEAGKERTIEVPAPVSADGVLRATLEDERGTPRAERLIFRKPLRAVRVEVAATPERGALRDHVTVTVKTRDADGNPVPATVTLAAVDDAVLETVEKRERAPRLPVEALLGSEVRELRDADAYLAGEGAAERTDLLLGTQGWRRFAFVDPDGFVARAGENAARALAAAMSPRAWAAELKRRAEEAAREVLRLEEEEKAEGGGWFARGRAPRVPCEAAPARVEGPRPAGARLEGDPGPADPGRADKDVALLRADGDDGKNVAAVGTVSPRRYLAPAAVVVREFAHHALRDRSGGRTDFAETLYWNAGLRTNRKGEATVQFDLADSVTTFRVSADALGSDGALGAGDATIEARRAFYCEPKLPLEVTTGDEIDLPIALVNGTARALHSGVKLAPTGPLVLADPKLALERDLAPEERARVLAALRVGAGQGEAKVRVEAHGSDEDDDVTRTLRVVAAGFPREEQAGGRLDAHAVHAFAIPADVTPGSIETAAVVYPSPLAALTKAVEALLREPCGCFEQTSSTNYPNVMALRYLSSHPGASPEAWEKARKLLDAGYARLVSFECREKGYEWFGGEAPGHEALTAYGVMEFTDMAAAATAVDQAMLARTRDWLLARRDGKGGFQRNPRALDSFGAAPEDVTDAYITWALVSARVGGLEREVASVREKAQSSADAYFLALAANVLLEASDPAAATIVAKLAKLEEADGSFQKEATSITHSGGESLAIETTSLAILALLRSPEHTERCERAMTWLLERAKGGRFGSTQGTILALKAIVAYDAAHAAARKPGTILLVVDGKVLDERHFSADEQAPIELPSFADALGAGKHTVELRLADGTAMPYSLTVRCHALTPTTSERCQVSLATRLAKTEVTEGEAVDVAVELANRTAAGLPMAVAIVGLPGGLEARVDQLKELVKQGQIDFFELRGRDVVLYRRALAPGEVRKLTLSCVAAIPGSYTGQASRAYLYYTDEEKCWVKPLAVKIDAR